MADTYVPVFFDWPEATKELNAQEKGRLIDAIVMYARDSGDWQEQIKGNERYLFPMFQAQIDRSKVERENSAQQNKDNGKKGGRPKKTKNPPVFSDESGTEKNPPVFLKTQNNKEEKEENNNENNHHLLNDDDRPKLDTVEAYAANNLRKMSPGNMQEMGEFIDKHGLSEDLIRYAIDKACGNGKPFWNYVASTLYNWLDAGIKTVGDAKAEDAARKRKDDDKGDCRPTWQERIDAMRAAGIKDPYTVDGN